MKNQLKTLTTVFCVFLLSVGNMHAQEVRNIIVSTDSMAEAQLERDVNTIITEKKHKQDFFNHLDIACTVGTTGVGIDLAMPVGDYLRVRAGYAFMPSIKKKINFRLHLEGENQAKKNMTPEEQEAYEKEQAARFRRYADAYEDVTGYHIEKNEINMWGRPTYYNGKFLIDVFPFRNKKWSFTAGFYYGASTVARAYNDDEANKLLVGIGMYNHMIDNPEFIIGDYEITLEDFLAGRRKYGVHFGDYFVEPDEDGMLKATVETNRFKPYVGFGFGNYSPKADKKYAFMLEAGVMFWGGTPKVMCQGEDLGNYDVSGKVGDYIKTIRFFKVFPVINLRISRRIF